MGYDCTKDVMEHKRKVKFWMDDFVVMLKGRAKVHDASKLLPPEKECFDTWTPRLRELTFGSDSYKQALDAMGEGLNHHYQVNRHHPEYHENGVDGMTLWDLIEMVCDWMAVAEAKGVSVDLNHAAQRFNLSSQLVSIICNTLKEIDEVNTLHNVPISNFVPD